MLWVAANAELYFVLFLVIKGVLLQKSKSLLKRNQFFNNLQSD